MAKSHGSGLGGLLKTPEEELHVRFGGASGRRRQGNFWEAPGKLRTNIRQTIFEPCPEVGGPLPNVGF
jgi:hypothetical protein